MKINCLFVNSKNVDLLTNHEAHEVHEEELIIRTSW